QAAPWFHQPGGGTQYRIIAPPGEEASVEALVDCGYLRRIVG
ncbi:glycohydrolase toxin TNT-related protein, partial [Mycobacterium heckeshornense]